MKLIKNKKILVLIILLICAAVFVFLEKTKVIDLYKKDTPVVTEAEQSTSTTKTAQSDFSAGEERQAGNTQSENKGTGGIVDSNGTTSSEIDMTNPTISKSGDITLYNPKQNSLLTTDLEVSGVSKLSEVSYRLIDDISGVINMGKLNVVDGKFSGKLSFQTNAKEGRLDFYGAKSDGTEFSNIEVPVRFK